MDLSVLGPVPVTEGLPDDTEFRTLACHTRREGQCSEGRNDRESSNQSKEDRDKDLVQPQVSECFYICTWFKPMPKFGLNVASKVFFSWRSQL